MSYKNAQSIPTMSSAEYTALESKPAATNEHHDSTLEHDPLLPGPIVDPYLRQQTWAYLQYLIPLVLVLLFPLIFAICVFAKGRVPASQRLAGLGMQYPQIKGQIVAILATSLTATTRWALSGAAALLARKRLLQPRPIYEIDMFFSLRNISVIWDWRHRRRMMFLTWLLVVVCGLLTSGFFTLLNPLALEVHIPHQSIEEINLAANSDLWAEWYNTAGFGKLVGSPGTLERNAPSSSVPSFLQSMTRQYLAPRIQTNVYSIGSFITTFAEFDYTSFSGSTAGTLVSGDKCDASSSASGQPCSPIPGYPLGRPESPNYGMDLQGTWINVSCTMDKAPPINATLDLRPDNPQSTGYANYNFTCPGSSILRQNSIRPEDYAIAVLDCPNEDGTTAIFFRPVFNTPFTPVRNMACIVSPQIGDVNVILDSNSHAFNATRKSTPVLSSLPPVAKNLTSTLLRRVTRHFQHTPLFSSISQAWNHVGSGGGLQVNMALEVVEMMLATVFEYEASYMRLELTANLPPVVEVVPPRVIPKPPSDAMREVKVMRIEHTIGWEVKWTTWLGLLPLVVVSVITSAMLAMAWWSEGELTEFDPMSPPSLLGAASVGKVVVSETASGNAVVPKQGSGKTIGHPLDEEVLSMKVSYAEKDGTWGLWSEDSLGNSPRESV